MVFMLDVISPPVVCSVRCSSFVEKSSNPVHRLVRLVDADHLARSRSIWSTKFPDIAQTLLAAVACLVPYFSSSSKFLAISIIASLTSSPSEVFFFLIKNCVALNEASVAFWVLRNAALNSPAFPARNVLPSG